MKRRPGVESAIAFPGLSIDGFTNTPNAGIVFVTLKPFEERKPPELPAGAIAGELNGKYRRHPGGFASRMFAAAGRRASATIGGFKLQIEDRAGLGYDALQTATLPRRFIGQAPRHAELAGVFTSYQVNVPQLDAEVDRTKAQGSRACR